jgi:catechol 2,3-dioxygenase-like lactoylglutathione lyase family enzyme
MIHHLEINVRNLSRSRIFWEWLLSELGYEKFQDWDHGFSFKMGKTYLVFVQAEKIYIKNNYHRKNIGLNHLAFHAGSKQIVDDITLKLKEKKAKILYPRKHPHAGGANHYAVYFEDPDRIKVEIVAEA